MVLIHHQIGRTGTGGTKTIVVAGAVLRAAYQRRVLPAAVVGLLAAEQRERLLGARAAGDNGNVQFPIECGHVPDRTAKDVIGVAACRIVEQILLRGDHLERILALGRIRGGYDVSPVITDHAGDKLVAQHRKTANADRVALLLGCRRQWRGLVDDLGRVGCRIDLQQVRFAGGGRGEIQLVVEFDGRTIPVHIDVVAQGFLHRHGHDLDFAGSGVDLQQQTAILAVVEE